MSYDAAFYLSTVVIVIITAAALSVGYDRNGHNVAWKIAEHYRLWKEGRNESTNR